MVPQPLGDSPSASRGVSVACDLFLDLRLYRVPEDTLDSLHATFPGLDVVPVNVPGASPHDAAGCEVYWGNRITAETVRLMPSLRWIHFGSVGTDRARIPEVKERGIRVTSSRGLMVAPMVASAVAFITGLARGIHHCARLRTEGRLSRESYDEYFDQIQDLQGQRCLIVGLGDVGHRLAEVCAAFGMKVDAIRRSTAAPPPPVVERQFTLDQLDEAARDADYVVNLLPATAETAGVFDGAVFGRMRPGAFFINIGRGETVDEPALIRALNRNEIAGAGLDVFAREPLTAESELWDLPNVMLTPHVAGLSSRYWSLQADLFTDNLDRFLSGRPLRNEVDLNRGY